MIQITEKPDWVSWDNIKQCLYEAHASNRAKGIIMRKPSLPVEVIKEEIGKDGVMLVAIDDNMVVGTAALIPKSGSFWFYKGYYGYMCFASVLPDYRRKGIYKGLCAERERMAANKGMGGLYIDTHHMNKDLIGICQRNGFERVGVKRCKDHWNVVLFKWLDRCPHAPFICWTHYVIQLAICRLHLYKLKTIFR